MHYKMYGKSKNTKNKFPAQRVFFFRITQYNPDTYNTRTLTPMNVRT